MDKNVNYTIVGAFIAFVMAAFAGFVIWFAGSYDTQGQNRYTIHFNNAIAGIDTGSTVKYLGVEVGRVKDIRLENMQSGLIKVDIQIDKRVPVNRTTKAVLKPQGITGQSYISLTRGDKDADPPERAGERGYPVIKGSGSRLKKLYANLPKLSTRLVELTDRLKRILSDKNIAAFSDTMANIEGFSATMDDKAGKTIDNVNTTIDRFDKTAKRAGAFIDKSGRAVDSLRKDLNGISGAIDHAHTVAKRIDRLTGENEEQIDQFLGTGLHEATRMLTKGRKAAANAEDFTSKVADQPSRLLFGAEYKGLRIPEE